MNTKPLVAIDADTLLFSHAAFNEYRSIEVLHKPSGKSKVFSNRTEFKKSMKDRGKEITADYAVKDKQEAGEISHVLQGIKATVEEILDNYSGFEVIFCCTAEDNFRDTLPYPRQYKGNRDSSLRPIFLKDAQTYLLEKYNAKPAMGCEVDDLVGILGYEAVKQGREGYVLSPDKDSKQFDGLRLGSYKSKPDECLKIDFMHDLKWDDGIVSFGFPWMIYQLTIGDVTDNLKPTHLCTARYGAKGFYNDTKDFKTPEEFAVFAVNKYKQWYPKEFTYEDWTGKEVKADWKFILNLYWKGIAMQREHNKLPDFWDFLSEKGLQSC